MRPHFTYLLAVCVATLGLLAPCPAGLAQTATFSSTVPEDNGATVTPMHEPNQGLATTAPANATTAGGYDYTATGYLALSSITSISVQLTIQDGDSNSGNFDFNHLTLGLDGIDTGLLLNGFRGGGLQDTFTFTGTPQNAAAILVALQSDGRLVGTIITNNPNDTALQPNEIFVGNDQFNATTLLTITGAVPEPGSFALAGVGLAAATVGLLRRRARRG